jgi:hypothetical protein
MFAAGISDTRFHVHGAIAETNHTPEQLDASCAKRRPLDRCKGEEHLAKVQPMNATWPVLHGQA